MTWHRQTGHHPGAFALRRRLRCAQAAIPTATMIISTVRPHHWQHTKPTVGGANVPDDTLPEWGSAGNKTSRK